MSQAHKGSRLLLKNQIVPVDFDTAHFSCNQDAYGIQYGDLIAQTTDSIYTKAPKEGRFGGGIWVEDSTVNLLSNVNAAQDWTKWDHYNHPNYWNQSTRKQIDDGEMGKVFVGTSGSRTVSFIYKYNFFPLVSGTVYTSSIYLRSDADYPDFNFYGYLAFDTNGGKVGTINQKGITTKWTRYSATITANASYTSGGIGWSFGTLPSGCTIYAAKPQIEAKAIATSFVETSRGAGALKYPSILFNPKSFTINIWVKFNSLNTSYNPLIEYIVTSTNRFLWMLDTQANNKVLATWADGPAGSTKDSSGFIPVIGQWYMLSVVFTGTQYKTFVNGVSIFSVNSSVSPSPTAPYLSLGGGNYGAANAIFSDAIIAPFAYSDEEIMAMFISNKPLYNPYDYRGYAY